jgi:hypothetical protein
VLENRSTIEALQGRTQGAVDLLHGTDGEEYQREMNAAPSLKDENTLGAYVGAIKRWAAKQR